MHVTFRKPTVADVKGIHSLLLGQSATGVLLPRSLSQLYNHCRDFYILLDAENKVLGCCALSVIWDDLAEIRSLLVDESLRGMGYGKQLVELCTQEAKSLGIHRLFTLTYQTPFFSRLGFAEVGKDVLPQKIWADCIHCPKFPECDEIAMLKEI